MSVSRVLKVIVSAVAFFADGLVQIGRRAIGWDIPARCVVLYYHAIRSDGKRGFEWQMDELRKQSRPIDLEDPADWPRSGLCTCVTFDDAFMSVVENALPALSARGIPCTIFVPVGSMGKAPIWIESSYHQDSAETVTPTAVVREIGASPLVRIGSHSMTHPDFRELNEDSAWHEMSESKRALENILGRSIPAFSFPHGGYTAAMVALAHRCGYSQVYGIEPACLTGPVQGAVIGRVRVDPEDWKVEFRLKLNGAYRWMVTASRWKRRVMAMSTFRHRAVGTRR